jgi:cytochrome c-type biogenesis protein
MGPFAAPVAGAAFAFGWTPCVGPVLASILALAAQQGHSSTAVVLLLAYSAGLALPFFAVALAFDRTKRTRAWLRRHGRIVTITSGVSLLVLGFLLLTDRMSLITTLALHLHPPAAKLVGEGVR